VYSEKDMVHFLQMETTHSKIVSPHFLRVEDWRGVVRNNRDIVAVDFVIETNRGFVPHVLVDCGYFPSTSEIKRNRPDLWIQITSSVMVVNLGWAHIIIAHLEKSE